MLRTAFFSVLVVLFALLARDAAALRVSGTVVDAAGAPVADARVWLSQARVTRSETTDAKGRFGFDDVATAPIEMVAYREGLALDGYAGFPAAKDEHRFVLGAAGRLALQVHGSDYRPLAGARVRALVVGERFIVRAEDLAAHGLPVWRSDDAGRLVAEGLPADSYVEALLAHVDYADTRFPYLPVRDEPQPVQLIPGVPLVGRVVGGDKPQPRARVIAYQLGAQGQRFESEVLTDVEGFYSMRLVPGEYLVTAKHADFAPAMPTSAALFDPELPQTRDLALLPARTITGSVDAPKGVNPAGVRVAYRVGDIIYEETYTGIDGAFALTVGPPEGQLYVQPPQGYMTETVGSIPVDFGLATRANLKPLKLVPLPEISGSVVGEDGKATANALITLAVAPVPVWTITDAKGGFRLKLDYMPPEPTVQILAEHALRFLRAQGEVRLDRTKPLELKLAPYDAAALPEPPPAIGNTSAALLGKPAPAWQCEAWVGAQPASLEQSRGKVVVLTFWGGFDRSPLGLGRLAELNALHTLLREQDDVAFVGIHDASVDPEGVMDYVRSYRIPYPVGVDADPFATFVAYGINYIPTTLLIDKQGVVQFDRVEGRLLPLIKELRQRAS